MNIMTMSKNKMGYILTILLIGLLMYRRMSMFLLNTVLGRSFLISFIIIISHINKFLGIFSVLFVFIILNTIGYKEGAATGTTDAATTGTTAGATGTTAGATGTTAGATGTTAGATGTTAGATAATAGATAATAATTTDTRTGPNDVRFTDTATSGGSTITTTVTKNGFQIVTVDDGNTTTTTTTDIKTGRLIYTKKLTNIPLLPTKFTDIDLNYITMMLILVDPSLIGIPSYSSTFVKNKVVIQTGNLKDFNDAIFLSLNQLVKDSEKANKPDVTRLLKNIIIDLKAIDISSAKNNMEVTFLYNSVLNNYRNEHIFRIDDFFFGMLQQMVLLPPSYFKPK